MTLLALIDRHPLAFAVALAIAFAAVNVWMVALAVVAGRSDRRVSKPEVKKEQRNA